MGRVTFLDAGVERPAANVDVTSIPGWCEPTKTDANGNYELGSGCPIGVYTIVFSGTGFQTLQVPNISIAAGQEYILNVQLTTGTGPVVTPGEGPVELCAGCHSGSVAEKHALAEADAVDVKLQHWNAGRTAAVKVNNVQLPAVSVDATTFDVTIRFNVWVSGALRNDFLQKATTIGGGHNEDAFWYYDDALKAGVRTKLSTAAFGTAGSVGTWQFRGDGNGNYTATITGFTALPREGTYFMVNVTPLNGPTATVVAAYGTSTHDVVSNESCTRCHGPHVWRGKVHDVTNAYGMGPCLMCHNRDGAVEKRLTGYIPAAEGSPAGTPPVQAAAPGTAGTGLMGIVHGIHNSRNMPDQTFSWSWTNGNTVNFSKGFPGYMNNCQTCHISQAQLAKVMGAPVSFALCISCHDSWDGFRSTVAGGPLEFHRSFTALTPQTTCATCHNGTGARSTAAKFHNGQVTERAGLIWDGADQSVVLAPTTVLDITGVSVSGTDLVVTWTATNSVTSTALNPCNQDFAQGPVFFGYTSSLNRSEGCTNTAPPAGCNSSFSILRAYAQANDWVNAGVTGSTSPGQPRSNNIAASNTTCASNDATTTVPLTAFDTGFTAPTKGIVAIQGKAQMIFPANGNIIFVRTQSPTREFTVADGSLPAAADQRRVLVDVNKCNACHLGTLYQHGGTRVDSIELCVMCHNPASSEQQNRVAMGVTAAEAYDGLPGQTYDMRYMVHAIHSAGAEYGTSPGYAPADANGLKMQIPGPLLRGGKQLMFYRSNGIFYFGSKETLATVPNWPLNGAADQCVSCVDVEDGPLTYCKVYGSVAAGDKPVRNADGSCGTPVASTDGTWRPHRVVEVEYPRALNDCGACHVDGAVDALPDPTKAVAVTYDTGAAPYNVQVNDALIGSSAASCMSCHRSADPAVQFGLQSHADGFGFPPTVFPEGRQTVIDAATP